MVTNIDFDRRHNHWVLGFKEQYNLLYSMLKRESDVIRKAGNYNG